MVPDRPFNVHEQEDGQLLFRYSIEKILVSLFDHKFRDRLLSVALIGKKYRYVCRDFPRVLPGVPPWIIPVALHEDHRYHWISAT